MLGHGKRRLQCACPGRGWETGRQCTWGGGGFPASIAHLEEKITSSHAEGESGEALGTHGGKIPTADLDPWEKKNL